MARCAPCVVVGNKHAERTGACWTPARVCFGDDGSVLPCVHMIAVRVAAAMVAFAITVPIAVLDLAGVRPGPGIPPHWRIREVRGQSAPDADVLVDGPLRRFRLRGAGRAAWFYRELDDELAEAPGMLHWSWRVLRAPEHADLRVDDRDDSPMRVFVVFGHPRFFRNRARIIFYSFGNTEPAGFQRPGAASDRLHVLRVDGAGERTEWRDHATDPFADYRRIWHEAPPSISSIGVMQDTDQTREEAVAELRRLDWVPAQ